MAPRVGRADVAAGAAVGADEMGDRMPVARCLLALLTVGLLATSCGQPAPTLSPKPAATPTPAASPSAALDPTTEAILQAYRAEWAAWQEAVTTPGDPIPNFPALATTTIDPLLLSEKKELVTNNANGIVGRGTYQLQRPHIASITGTTATVRDCIYSTVVQVYASNGQAVPNQPGGTQPENDAEEATLTEVAPGKWMASNHQEVLGQCPPGY